MSVSLDVMAAAKSPATRKLGEALRRARGAQLSQENVATAADINPSNYGKYERGELEMGLHMLIQLAHALGTTPASLLADIAYEDLPYADSLQRAVDVREARVVRRGGR